MGMALGCDLRLAVPQAKFFYPVMKLGFLPQPSDPGRLAALVGLDDVAIGDTISDPQSRRALPRGSRKHDRLPR